jgi:predicted aspartyl protease
MAGAGDTSPMSANGAREGLDVRAELRKRARTHRTTGILVTTRRDPNGRILAPVKINGQGSFELIVNTGAGRSALSEAVARRLRLSLDTEPPILVHGVTGSTSVPTVRVDSMALGHLRASAIALPIIANTFGSADGFLSLTDFVAERILLDMQRNKMILPQGVAPSGAFPGGAVLRMDPAHVRVMAVDARVHGITVKAIVDTGAECTLANLALRKALTQQVLSASDTIELVGATVLGQISKPQPLPAMELGSLRILGARIAYGDLPLFEYLKWNSTPAMLLGMDILGQFESLLLDYQNRLIRFQPRTSRRH